ncbi:MAG: cobalt-precorrin-6A reductase [Pseudomonadota bacterium]
MKVLVLGGTGEGRALAHLLADTSHDVTVSLAGATRQPKPLPGRTRIGGFGGDAGFAQWLQDAETDAVIDATHPFASRVSDRSVRVARDLAIPYLQVLRPAWQPNDADIWHRIADETQAADLIPQGATVFLATGRQTLMQFANLENRRIYCRQIDPPDTPFPFSDGAFMVGRPPFSVAEEINLFDRLKIDWLVVKNAGGAASRTKLDAAAQLGLPVAMIDRPPQPDCDRVTTPEEAMAWLKGLRP